MTVEDSVDVCFCPAACVRELLNKFIATLDIAGTFLNDILRQQVVFFGINAHAQMFSFVNQGKLVATQYHLSQLPIFVQICHTFGFRLRRVFVCAESEIVCFGVSLANV